MQEFDVFEVRDNSDKTEGRGPMYHVAYFTDAGDANKLKSSLGWGADVRPAKVIIYHDIEEYQKGYREAVRKSALQKLNAEEKEALGLEG